MVAGLGHARSTESSRLQRLPVDAGGGPVAVGAMQQAVQHTVLRLQVDVRGCCFRYVIGVSWGWGYACDWSECL